MIKNFYTYLKKKINKYFDNITLTTINSLPFKKGVTLVDIGAAGEIEPRWKPFSSKLNYIAFEPDERSRSKIFNNKKKFLDYKILPYALSQADEQILINYCEDPQKSSKYEPNYFFLKNFPNNDRFNIIKKVAFPSTTLDSLEIKDIDFIKIDIQGSELDVIKGAKKTLKSTFGLEIEVEFLNVYKKQPLFGEICLELKNNGFEFIDFVNLSRWERHNYNYFGQCVFGDAFFIKTPESLDLENLNSNNVCSYLFILLIYNRFDIIESLLNKLSIEKRHDFKDFERHLKKAKSRNNKIRLIFKIMDKIFSLTGTNNRLHLLS
ncbi:FkbM family methyltransferase [Alphaproteobacteria bacterium]|nr:FkbM family methyltransferase [Alphaproteobacteria bacterium]